MSKITGSMESWYTIECRPIQDECTEPVTNRYTCITYRRGLFFEDKIFHICHYLELYTHIFTGPILSRGLMI